MNLDAIRIAESCPANWADMKGDDRKRLCGLCTLHVYNISELTRQEAETLLTSDADTKACVRLYRRKDGTILTKDCPVGLRDASRRLVSMMAAGYAVLIGALLWGSSEIRHGDRFGWGRLLEWQPFKAIAALVHHPPPDPNSVPWPTSPRGRTGHQTGHQTGKWD